MTTSNDQYQQSEEFGRSFESANSYQIYEHTAKKLFDCEDCGKSFAK